jgi:hypothetical protein
MNFGIRRENDMKMYHISDRLGKNHIYTTIEEVIEDIRIGIEESEIGESITITSIEMTHEEYNNSPIMFNVLTVVKMKGD